ncbi:MAG: hypothetical protein EOP04_22765 [Proteobacteria bacterium]|nr:MAG: hypothetical protein EOP04_22765 [Pseudomonadota bacterium]
MRTGYQAMVFLTLIFNIEGCGFKPEVTNANLAKITSSSSGLTSDGTVEYSAGEGSDDESSNPDNIPPTDATADDEVAETIDSPPATPPTVIAGAPLFCHATVDKKLAACEIQGKRRPLHWQIVGGDNVVRRVEVKKSVKRENSAIYFVETNNFDKGTIQTKNKGDDDSKLISTKFDRTAEEFPFSVPVFKREIYSGFGAASSSYFFGPSDGKMSKCKFVPSASATSQTLSFDLSKDMTDGEIALSNVCGLESLDAVAKLVRPAPFKPIYSRLMPSSDYVRLFQNLDLPAGHYSIRISNAAVSHHSQPGS